MDKPLIRIAFTTPYFYEGEAEAITRMLAADVVDYVHIRKPDADAAAVGKLIAKIPDGLRRRITLHDHAELAPAVGGIHLNSRMTQCPEGWSGRLSVSLHSIEEVERETRNVDYVTLSPIFPSISKPGYTADFDTGRLRRLLSSKQRPKVIALGGVDASRIEAVREFGFDGYAMLGAAWRREIKAEDFRLQFITNPASVAEAVAQTREALAGGCRWIQLRWKDADDSLVEEAARQIAPLCRNSNAVFLLDDRVELVKPCGADGVHLGKNDMAVYDARRILGPAYIIGATANTTDDISAAAKSGADYIGYGPFRFTTTKKNLSPVLGLRGYSEAVAFLRRSGLALPIVAIGGIKADDIPAIIGTGVGGIAVSGSIINAPSPADATRALLDIIANSSENTKTL